MIAAQVIDSISFGYNYFISVMITVGKVRHSIREEGEREGEGKGENRIPC